jgi:hypothetical protein
LKKWLVTFDDGDMTVEEADLPHTAAKNASDAVHTDFLYTDELGRFVYTLFDAEGNNTGDLYVEEEGPDGG